MDRSPAVTRRVAEVRTRRYFLRKSSLGLGSIALGSLLGYERALSTGDAATRSLDLSNPMAPRPPHFAPRAKRVIFLYMAGAPSQLELFDHKPELRELHWKECPPSLLEGKRFAFIQGVPRLLGPQAAFERRGESGIWVSEFLPHFSRIVDEVTLLKAMHTDEFNHAPGQLLMLTGSSRLGHASMGSWITYGLGSENENLPGFIVLLSGPSQPDAGKAAWASGFLPTVYEGVQCRSEGDPVLFVSDPEGMTRPLRRQTLDAIGEVNEQHYREMGDPDILSRIAQYEMAFRMQISVPEAMELREEPAYIHQLYGTEPGKASFANNCLLARRLAERGVRFIQLFHWGWDSHGTSEGTAVDRKGLGRLCAEVDRPTAALLRDLKQRGMLEDTLVVWGGEFGRTPMLENRGGADNPFLGRDHHSEAFAMWLAGAGVKKGFSFGETDEIGYSGVKDRVHVHDLQATLLHLLGIDHERLTYRFQGRDFRLTDVHGHVVHPILA
jgi:hypothetical protein